MPQDIAGSFVIAVHDENGQKVIYLPYGDEYTFNVTATGYGTLSISKQDYSLNDGGFTDIINYYDIQIAESDVISGTVLPIADAMVLSLNGTDGLPISASETMNSSEIARFTVTVETEGDGIVVGGGMVRKGEYVQLTATPYQGGAFLGWYANDTLVNDGDDVYRFRVVEDVTIQAKFTTVPRNKGSSFTGNSNTTKSTDSITVVESNGGKITVDKTTPKSGDTVVITATPDDGYKLGSLTVTDSNGKELAYANNNDGTFTLVVGDGKITINAIFIKTLPCTDVIDSDWYYDAVKYAYENGLFNGTSATEFSPNTTMTRGMMVTVLHRLAGSPNSDASSFTDVASDTWYSDAINWAASVGIVNGIGNNLFAPTQEITREQMAVILYNYCIFKGIELLAIRENGSFADADAVSDWAAEAVQAMYQAGILNGKGNGIFDPKGTATRAEVAQMFMNFMEAIK